MQPKHLYNLVSFLLASALAIAVTAGCTPRKLMVTQFAHMVQAGLPAVEQEQDLQLLAGSMPGHIKLLETLLANDPGNRELLILLARLYGGYAFAVLETEFEARRWEQPSVLDVAMTNQRLEDAMARYFQRGAQYALRVLEIDYPLARQRLGSPQSIDGFMNTLSVKDVPALFWYGFNLGGYIHHRLDSITALARAHQVEKTMRRVVALDETYYHGGAHLALLAYYASRSPMTGGSPAQAEAHFKRHQHILPDTIGLRQLYWARYVLVQRQQKGRYLHQLRQVSQALISGQASGVLASVAVTRARIYLGAVDQFFD